MVRPGNMKDLIKALQILAKYTDSDYPTHCEHDILYVNVRPEKVSDEDKENLEKLGFIVGDPDGCGTQGFYSFKYGSC